MLFFLARFELRTTHYMSDGAITEDVIRIVIADDLDSAYDKVKAAYPDDLYSTYYEVRDLEITSAIL